MTSTLFKRLAAACFVTGAVAAAPGVAAAHDTLVSSDGAFKSGYLERHLDQHGGTGGHLAPTSSNVDLISSLRLKNVEPEKKMS